MIEDSTSSVMDSPRGLREDARGVDSAGSVEFNDVLPDFNLGSTCDERLDFFALVTACLPASLGATIGLFP